MPTTLYGHERRAMLGGATLTGRAATLPRSSDDQQKQERELAHAAAIRALLLIDGRVGLRSREHPEGMSRSSSERNVRAELGATAAD